MRPAAALALAVFVLVLSGCTRSDELDKPLLPVPSTTSTTTSPAPVPTRAATGLPRSSTSASPSPTGFSEAVAVPCNGRPTGEQVIAMVRRQPSLVSGGVTVTVKTGPMCAGTWQYTVLTVSGSEPLQVVTRGAPNALTIVTAGTDVCTAQVQAAAPLPLRTLARC